MASKRRLRRRQCGDKTPMTEDAAWSLARARWKQGVRFHAYRCPFCKHWHVGHFGPRDEVKL